MKTKKVFATTFAIAVLCYVLGLMGCGGRNGSSGNNPPPTPLISVNGPASVMVGQQAQYTAAENGSPITPTWSVNTVTGGNSTVGTISAAGLYTAPQAVPNPANVTITATSSGATAGSVSVTINPPTNPTIVSFVASPGTIQSGGSSTLSWTTNNGVSLSINQGVCNPCTPVNQGSIVVTPTETTTYTLTATGAAGTTPATAQATVTVTAGSGGDNPTITPPIDPFMIFLRGDWDQIHTVIFTVNCVNCQSGDTLTQSYYFPPLPLGSGNLNQFAFVDYYPSAYDTGLNNVQIDPPSGGTDSNIVPFANIGDQNPLAFETDDGSAFFLGNGGTAYKFNQTGQFVTSFPAGRWDVAVDNAVGSGNTSTDDVLVANGDDLMGIFGNDGNPITTIGIVGNGSAVAAMNGLACVTYANQPQFSAAYLPGASQFSPPPTATQPLSAQPLAIKMGYVDNNTYAFVLTADGNLWKYQIAGNSQGVTITPIGNPNQPFALPGFTPLSQIHISQFNQNGDPQKSMVDAGWTIAVFNTGTAAGNAVVFDRYDGLAWGVALSPFQTVSWTQNNLTGYRLVADEANGVANLGMYNAPPTTTTSYERLNALTGAPSSLSAQTPTPSISIGHGVHPNTGNIWWCSGTTCNVLDNQ